MNRLKKTTWLLFLFFNAFIMLFYNLKALRSYEKKEVFEQLSPFGQKVFNTSKVIMPLSVPEWMRPYAHFTGYNTGYSLFAPNVPTAISVIFELSDDAGNTVVQLPSLLSSEGLDRLSGNYGTFKSYEEFRQLLAYGWGMRMLEVNENYNKVAVVIAQHRMPGLKEYRDGERTSFKEIGRYEFVLTP